MIKKGGGFLVADLVDSTKIKINPDDFLVSWVNILFLENYFLVSTIKSKIYILYLFLVHFEIFLFYS